MGVCVALVNKLDPPGPARVRKKAPWKGALTLFEWTHTHYFIVQQHASGSSMERRITCSVPRRKNSVTLFYNVVAV